MSNVKLVAGKTVFGLDIGTRSVVGTVGYKKGDTFYCTAQRIIEHDTRAMIDGQIHDIPKVGETINQVKEQLEEAIGYKLTDVCIAAAGRVLKTITVHSEITFPFPREITEEDIFTLKSQAVQEAYVAFTETDTTNTFYSVGNSIIRYYMNGYPMSNLEGHKASNIAVDLIATFLPEDVIDGLYKAVDIAGLRVANLTLEPIAAIQVAIPENFRMLNLALIDVGAGTSNACITEDGSIPAYSIIPSAGARLTEIVAKHCLVDFAAGEKIKMQLGETDEVEYEDVLGFPQVIRSADLLELLRPQLNELAKAAADKILELNGGKPVSAVFVVGGGGKIPGYTELVADYLGIVKQRAAIRGKEVMGNIVFSENITPDSTLVTPLGICLNYYEQNNSFIIVTFNDKRIKLYDNDKLSVVYAALQADFPNVKMFPQRGDTLQFTVNKKPRSVKGQLGEAAVIKIGNREANIYSPIHENDIITVKESTKGAPGAITIGALPEFRDIISVQVQEKRIDVPKYAKVNGAFQSAYYEIRNGDEVEVLDYCTVGQLLEFMDVILPESQAILVNHKPADRDTKVYENYLISFVDRNTIVEDTTSTVETEANEESVQTVQASEPKEVCVIVNRKPVYLSGKKEYVFVDVFDFISFDLSKPQGSGIVTTLNGRNAEYMEPIVAGDVIEIYWRD